MAFGRNGNGSTQQPKRQTPHEEGVERVCAEAHGELQERSQEGALLGGADEVHNILTENISLKNEVHNILTENISLKNAVVTEKEVASSLRQTLKDEVLMYSNRISEHQAKIDDLHASNAKLITEKMKMISENEKLKGEIDANDEENERLKHLLEGIISRNSSLEKKLKSTQEEAESSVSAIERLHKSATKAGETVLLMSLLGQQFSGQKQSNSANFEDCWNESENQIKTLQRKRKSLERELSEQECELEDAHRRNSELENKLNNNACKTELAKKKFAALNQRAEKAEAAEILAKDELEILRLQQVNELAEMEQIICDTQEENADLKMQLKKSTEDMYLIQDRTAACMTEFEASCTQEKADLERELETAKEEVRVSHRNIENLKESQKEKDAQFDGIFCAMEAEFHNLKVSCDSDKRKLEQLIEELQSQLLTSRDELAEMKEELGNLYNRNTDLEDKINEKESEIELLKDVVVRLNERTKTAEEVQRTLHDDLQGAKQTLCVAQKDSEELQQQLTIANKEIAESRAELKKQELRMRDKQATLRKELAVCGSEIQQQRHKLEILKPYYKLAKKKRNNCCKYRKGPRFV
ncbi:hypothetical protein CAPTEDRAFT_187952 [Capitella teleta]|uniref:Uncharacterized protein n=1 Tax=Capitella teleta TaxID=283909 RepID=R7U4T3_CAPTE|nr:hypothetical protein CAPTEDRAFT_187952 [Capitella teleta]|eukprot:ELU01126.1 hypothetical protein CAPTEDRAFT_187952 [Capitella teleta]